MSSEESEEIMNLIRSHFTSSMGTISKLSQFTGRGHHLNVRNLDDMIEQRLYLEYTRVEKAKKLLVKIASMTPSQKEDPVYLEALNLAISNLRAQVLAMSGESFGMMNPKRLSPDDWMAIDRHVKSLNPANSEPLPHARHTPEYRWLKGINSSVDAPTHPQMLADAAPPSPTPWDIECITRFDTGNTDIVYLYPGAQGSDSVGAHGNLTKLFVPSRRFIYDYQAVQELERNAELRWDSDLQLDHKARAFMLSFLRQRMKRVDSRGNWRLDTQLHQVLRSDMSERFVDGKIPPHKLRTTMWQEIENLEESVSTVLEEALEHANAEETSFNEVCELIADGTDYSEYLDSEYLDKTMLMLLNVLEESQVIDLDWLVPYVYTDDSRLGATNTLVHPGYARVAGRFMIEALMRNVHLAIDYFAAGKRQEELTSWNFFAVDEA